MQPDNAWMVYQYQDQLREAGGLDVKTIDAKLRHIHKLVASLEGKKLSDLTKNDIKKFKVPYNKFDLDDPGTVADLAPPTVVQVFNNVRLFLEWLTGQTGYKSLELEVVTFCAPPNRLNALAHVQNPKHVPPPEDIRKTLLAMPAKSATQRRDRAILALLYLSGARDGAVISLRLKHVNVEQRLIFQDAKQVRTKFSKTMRTHWLPVGEDFEKVVIDWVRERRSSGASDEDPVFPKAKNALLNGGKTSSEEFLKSAALVPKIIKRATEVAEVPYFIPHAIRSTLGQQFYKYAQNLEELKAMSQNLGHENLRTTLEHYGEIPETRQYELLRDIWERWNAQEDQSLIQLIERLPAKKRKQLRIVAEAFLEN
ncbi:Tyrosine recombinase XerC [Roseibium album]|nr:Tyrosine recombinase XerC [Roseibium album]